MERYTVKMTIKTEIRWKNRVRKRRIVGRVYETKCSCKGHRDRNRQQEENNRSVLARLVCIQGYKSERPQIVKVSPRGHL